MRHPRRIALAVVALTACASPGASADQPSKRDGFRLVSPAHRFGGLTAGDMMGQAWHRAYARPRAENQLFGNGKRCVRRGPRAKVLFPTRGTCTAPPGTAVVINGFTATCSDIERPPFFGADEAAQRKCASRLLRREVESVTLTVDGGEVTDLHKRRYEIFSPQRHVVLPPNNVFGVPAQSATFTARGWEAWLTKLPRGRHPLRVKATFHHGPPRIFTPVINVVRRHRDRAV